VFSDQSKQMGGCLAINRIKWARKQGELCGLAINQIKMGKKTRRTGGISGQPNQKGLGAIKSNELGD
jgi:hypothetical protein